MEWLQSCSARSLVPWKYGAVGLPQSLGGSAMQECEWGCSPSLSQGISRLCEFTGTLHSLPSSWGAQLPELRLGPAAFPGGKSAGS